jgi:hypothetical protein
MRYPPTDVRKGELDGRAVQRIKAALIRRFGISTVLVLRSVRPGFHCLSDLSQGLPDLGGLLADALLGHQLIAVSMSSSSSML